MRTILVVDTETTGLDPAEHGVVEFAAVQLREYQLSSRDVPAWQHTGWAYSGLCDPGRTIPPEASAVHHLVDADVVGELRVATMLETLLGASELSPDDVVCAAHNAPFDRGFLPGLDHLLWLDTLRCARHLYPEAPRHGNQVLRYYLGLDGPSSSLPPHRALPDAEVTASLLLRMLETRSLEDLLALQDQPVLERVCRFGKHRGQEWSTVPRDYLSWLLRQRDLDPDVRHTADYWSRAR